MKTRYRIVGIFGIVLMTTLLCVYAYNPIVNTALTKEVGQYGVTALATTIWTSQTDLVLTMKPLTYYSIVPPMIGNLTISSIISPNVYSSWDYPVWFPDLRNNTEIANVSYLNGTMWLAAGARSCIINAHGYLEDAKPETRLFIQLLTPIGGPLLIIVDKGITGLSYSAPFAQTWSGLHDITQTSIQLMSMLPSETTILMRIGLWYVSDCAFDTSIPANYSCVVQTTLQNAIRDWLENRPNYYTTYAHCTAIGLANATEQT